MASNLKSTIDTMSKYKPPSHRLIYDYIEAVDQKKLTGLLMLIVFEKAFDSLSWKFLYDALAFFGYSESFIKWIQLFNTEITAYVVPCSTQFADDTTLILDGCQHSLQSALNTLEIFGNISGLKMNKEKTKVIWIGRKKFLKEKLPVSVKLEWGNTDFVRDRILNEPKYNRRY